ncbi:hypothetical protein [Brevibacillus sp. AF8]|uniref:hypothetical protein n=1 Tax=Brevibacillus sp. AF8 TaxID=2825881 RepID=UPI001E450A7E|nr:hypothetical protein [Brevibacillus sp. AF8]MCE0450058.1 hypothetical protein [Brevibacillus sp. AF8]
MININIYSSDIWHSYCSYFLEDNLDLESIAKKIILFNAAEIVVSSGNTCYWRDENKDYQETNLSVEKKNAFRSKVQIPSGMSPLNIEFIYQSQSMIFHEQKLYSKFEQKNNYIRIYF